jgi:hypothetical protein
MLAIEANDEWLVGRCYMSRQSMEALCALWTEATISHNIQQQEVAQLVAPRAANHFTDETSDEFLHHFPGLDCWNLFEPAARKAPPCRRV